MKLAHLPLNRALLQKKDEPELCVGPDGLCAVDTELPFNEPDFSCETLA